MKLLVKVNLKINLIVLVKKVLIMIYKEDILI